MGVTYQVTPARSRAYRFLAAFFLAAFFAVFFAILPPRVRVTHFRTTEHLRDYWWAERFALIQDVDYG